MLRRWDSMISLLPYFLKQEFRFSERELKVSGYEGCIWLSPLLQPHQFYILMVHRGGKINVRALRRWRFACPPLPKSLRHLESKLKRRFNSLIKLPYCFEQSIWGGGNEEITSFQVLKYKGYVWYSPLLKPHQFYVDMVHRGGKINFRALRRWRFEYLPLPKYLRHPDIIFQFVV